MIKYSIGICTYNRCDMLARCLDALAINIKGRTDYEVIVINNNSSDATLNIMETYPDVRCITESRQGLSFARNRFINESKGEFLLFLDDDAIITGDILDSYDKAIANFPDSIIFGGRVLPEKNIKIPSWFDSCFHMAYSILDIGQGCFYFKRPYGPIGANFLVKKNAIGAIRFRTDLGRIGDKLLSGEETDFIIKVSAGIRSVYVGDAVVNHHFDLSRYSKQWACERFNQNGYSDYLIRKENRKHVIGLLSQTFHFIKSFSTFNVTYILCRYNSLICFIKCIVSNK